MDYDRSRCRDNYEGDDEGDPSLGRRMSNRPLPKPRGLGKAQKPDFCRSWHGRVPTSQTGSNGYSGRHQSALLSDVPDYLQTVHVPRARSRSPTSERRLSVNSAFLRERKGSSSANSDSEKGGFLEKCKLHVLTRHRKPGEKFFFRLTKTYFQYHESETSSIPKRCEVRLKITRVTSTRGSGFDVQFRNGHTWHLAAGNLVEKIEWMEAIMPGSYPAEDRAKVINHAGIDGPAMVPAISAPLTDTFRRFNSSDHPSTPIAPTSHMPQTLAQPTANTSTTEASNASRTEQVPQASAAPRRKAILPPKRNYRAPASTTSDDQRSISSMDDDPDLLEKILNVVEAMDLDSMIVNTQQPKVPPELPDDGYSVVTKTNRPSSDYIAPVDDPRADYMQIGYEDDDKLGMAGDSIVELASYRVVSDTPKMATAEEQAPRDSEKFLTVAMEQKDVLSEQLRISAKVISPSQIQIKQQIGKGAFGEVHLAEWQFRMDCPPIEVAIKSLNPGADEKAEQDFLAEARIMADFDHQNIVRLFGVVDDDAIPRIITEYMSNGSLRDFLVHIRTTDPLLRPLSQLLSYIVDIAAGVHYLAAEGFIHRDLAARNVLVSEDERCKITDFGLSRKLTADSDEYVSTGGLLPLKWTSPEAGIDKCFTTASDVWSLGVTMWEVMTFGKKPYAQLSFLNLFPNLQRGVRLGIPLNCPDELYNLMKKCWEWEKENRPTTLNICETLQAILKQEMRRDTVDTSDTEDSGGS